MDKYWEFIAPHLLDYNFTIPKTSQNKVSEKIRNFYFGTKEINKSSIHNLIRMVSDRLFYYGTENIVKLIAKKNKSPVWFYLYDYRANNSLSDYLSKTNTNYGN